MWWHKSSGDSSFVNRASARNFSSAVVISKGTFPLGSETTVFPSGDEAPFELLKNQQYTTDSLLVYIKKKRNDNVFDIFIFIFATLTTI